MPYVIRIDNASLGQHFRTQGFYLAACKRRQRPVVITILVGLFSLLASNLFAAEPPAGLTSFLRDTCIDCHDGNTETNLDLSTLEFELKTPANFRQWVHVFDRVQRREMPPTSEPVPDEQNRLDALAQLKAELKTFNQQAQQKAQDPVVQMQQAELQLKQGELQRKAAKDQADAAEGAARLQLDAKKAETTATIEASRIATQNEQAQAKNDLDEAKAILDMAKANREGQMPQ